MAGGADVILLPELGFDMDQINEVILDRARRGKPYSIVVVAEGIETPDKERPSVYVTRVIEEATGIESRDTVLGYIQRGGNPSPFDRNLATRLGGHATELIANRQFRRMVCMKGSEVESIPLSEVAGKLKLVTPEHDLIIQGKRMGISFGNNFQREQLLCLFPLFFSLYLLSPVRYFLRLLQVDFRIRFRLCSHRFFSS